MRTLGEAVDQLVGAEAGGFDVSRQRAASLLNEGVERFASRSEWLRGEVVLGPTVVGQEQYQLPTNVVRVKGLIVAGVPYSATDVQSVWQYKVTGLPRRVDGVYAERYNEDGGIRTIGLLPVPEEGGIDMQALAVLLPGDLKEEDELPFPVDYRRGPLDYATGIAYETLDENPEAGAVYLERGATLADELRRLANSRLGSGPYQIPVATAR